MVATCTLLLGQILVDQVFDREPDPRVAAEYQRGSGLDGQRVHDSQQTQVVRTGEGQQLRFLVSFGILLLIIITRRVPIEREIINVYDVFEIGSYY